MTRKTRIAVVVAMALLSLVFVFPLWSIELWAPQYPEGLAMQIWLNRITGDLGNINLLNHYIGMHPIVPESLPELKIMMPIFGALVVLGLLVAALGRRGFLYVYTLLIISLSTVALYDFYAWEYKYGHELDPNAAIKMEGESYQPPLIGVKQMMNIEAWSLPATGGYGHLSAVMIVVVASWVEWRKGRKGQSA